MTQLDLILETYVHGDAAAVAHKVSGAAFASHMWTQWKVRVAEGRGLLGVRWILDDRRYTGSTEVWIEAVADDACVVHSFVRVDRRAGRVTSWRRRRVRAEMLKVLWRLKDDVENRATDTGG